MKLSTIFRRLNNLYSDERRWVQDTYRTDKKFDGTRALQCFCLVGGLEKVGGEISYRNNSDPRYAALFGAIKELHPGTLKTSVEAWNDVRGRKISDIRAVVKLALKNAQKVEAANA